MVGPLCGPVGTDEPAPKESDVAAPSSFIEAMESRMALATESVRCRLRAVSGCWAPTTEPLAALARERGVGARRFPHAPHRPA